MQSVRDRDRSPPPLECGWRHTSNVQGGGVLVNVQEWGCFSILRRVDDVTRTMSKGCVCLWMDFANITASNLSIKSILNSNFNRYNHGLWICPWICDPLAHVHYSKYRLVEDMAKDAWRKELPAWRKEPSCSAPFTQCRPIGGLTPSFECYSSFEILTAYGTSWFRQFKATRWLDWPLARHVHIWEA